MKKLSMLLVFGAFACMFLIGSSQVYADPLSAMYWTGISGYTGWMGTDFTDNGVLVDYAVYRNTLGGENFFEDVQAKLDDLDSAIEGIEPCDLTAVQSKLNALEAKLDTIIELVTTPQGRRSGWNE